MSIARSRAFDRKRKAVCGPDIMTGRRSAEEQNLSHYIAEYPELARLLSDLVSGPCFAADELPLPATAERRASTASGITVTPGITRELR